jgi:hypothetical protein
MRLSMNREINMNIGPQHLDLAELERHARILRARYFAQALRNAAAWMRGRVSAYKPFSHGQAA